MLVCDCLGFVRIWWAWCPVFPVRGLGFLGLLGLRGFVGVMAWVIGACAEMVAVLGWLFGCARGVTFGYLVCNMVCNFCQPCVTVFVIFVTLLDFRVLMCYMPMFCSVGWVYSGCEIVGISVSLCLRGVRVFVLRAA